MPPTVQATASSNLDGNSLDLFRPVQLNLQLAYKDQSGHSQVVAYTAYTTGYLIVSGTTSNITATLTVTYSHCDPTQSATCSLTVTAAPN